MRPVIYFCQQVCQIRRKSAIGIVAAVGALKFGFGILLLFGYFLKHWRPPGLLIRPETSKTKAKTETRECETETETETKKLL